MVTMKSTSPIKSQMSAEMAWASFPNTQYMLTVGMSPEQAGQSSKALISQRIGHV